MEERHTEEIQMNLQELKEFLKDNTDCILTVSVGRGEDEGSKNKTGVMQSGG